MLFFSTFYSSKYPDFFITVSANIITSTTLFTIDNTVNKNKKNDIAIENS